jgi:gas vesicle protein
MILFPWGKCFPSTKNIKKLAFFRQWYNFFLTFNKRKCMTSNTKIILGMLAAAAAGAAFGVLVAPEKGTELRKKIKNRFDEVLDDLAELLAVGKDEIKDLYKEAREDMQQSMDNVKSTVSETYSQMQHGQN